MRYIDWLRVFVDGSQIFGLLRILLTTLSLSVILILLGAAEMAVLLVFVLVFEFAYNVSRELLEIEEFKEEEEYEAANKQPFHN
jgi:hypothetical protein